MIKPNLFESGNYVKSVFPVKYWKSRFDMSSIFKNWFLKTIQNKRVPAVIATNFLRYGYGKKSEEKSVKLVRGSFALK